MSIGGGWGARWLFLCAVFKFVSVYIRTIVLRSFPPEFRIRNSGSGIPEQINLALECINSDVCSAEFLKFRGTSGLPENEDRQEPEIKTKCTS